MKIDPACYPCALRRILATASRITDDPWLHHKLLAKAMTELAEMERDVTPAEMMQNLESVVSSTLGSKDPYQKLKADWAAEISGLMPKVEERVGAAKDPLEAALALAGRANIFDDECSTQREIRELLRREEIEELAVNDLDRFLKDLEGAERLLFCHDSAPELPFDRLLIERLLEGRSGLRVTSVVRAQPVLLDAVREDVEEHRLLDLEGVDGTIDPGIPALGIPLNECTREFRDAFEAADVVLAKGQAHYETLADESKTSYFLLRVKCSVMAKHQGLAIGDLAFLRA